MKTRARSRFLRYLAAAAVGLAAAGAVAGPAQGDEVLVTFEPGGVHPPFVIGSLWSGDDAPPETGGEAQGGGPHVRASADEGFTRLVVAD